MLQVRLGNDAIRFGGSVTVTFERTLRIPDDGKTYPLPPGLGRFPVLRVADYADRVPAAWRERGGVFIPMYQREAMWICFEAREWKPNAVKVGVGKINAVTGEPWKSGLPGHPQDYLVCPDQPWLDGIKAGDGFIKQFVAMPLGMGYTVEGQLTGKEEFGGIQLMVFEPKPGRFPDRPPRALHRSYLCCMQAPRACSMGLGAGGRMRQKIYRDKHGISTWDLSNYGRVYVHIANSMMYRDITGQEPPATPVTTRQYTRNGLPWFDLYDEDKADVAPGKTFGGVKSVKEMDQQKGFGSQQDDEPIEVPDSTVIKLGLGQLIQVKDGEW